MMRVEELHIAAGQTPLVRGVSFALEPGERVGLVGESGSGKSLTALSIMRLNPPPTHVTAGQIFLGDQDLTLLSEREMTGVRGRRVAMIYQDPLSSLNPVRTIGRQVVEAIRIHSRADGAEARARELLDEVGVPTARFGDHPHQFSGGMRQRVMIAMAIACGPDVLIADEPTTALDVTTQSRILELLDRLAAERGMAVLLITHDLGVAAGFCDRIEVMYAGRIVESAPVRELFARPRHPYTRALLASVPTFALDPDLPIPAVGGQPPVAGALPGGCPFHPRCPLVEERCRTTEPLTHPVACHLVEAQ